MSGTVAETLSRSTTVVGDPGGLTERVEFRYAHVEVLRSRRGAGLGARGGGRGCGRADARHTPRRRPHAHPPGARRGQPYGWIGRRRPLAAPPTDLCGPVGIYTVGRRGDGRAAERRRGTGRPTARARRSVPGPGPTNGPRVLRPRRRDRPNVWRARLPVRAVSATSRNRPDRPSHSTRACCALPDRSRRVSGDLWPIAAVCCFDRRDGRTPEEPRGRQTLSRSRTRRAHETGGRAHAVVVISATCFLIGHRNI